MVPGSNSLAHYLQVKHIFTSWKFHHIGHLHTFNFIISFTLLSIIVSSYFVVALSCAKAGPIWFNHHQTDLNFNIYALTGNLSQRPLKWTKLIYLKLKSSANTSCWSTNWINCPAKALSLLTAVRMPRYQEWTIFAYTDTHSQQTTDVWLIKGPPP